MATEAKLRQLADKGCSVYYFYSSERYLVRQAVAAAVRVLSADSDEDATILDGAAPELEQLIMAAGTISFFGTRRVVVLPEIDPAAYGSKDLDELCSTLSSLENAVAVLGSVFPLERSKLKLGKQAQKLQVQCKAIGYTEELAKPRPFELKNLMMERAKAQGAALLRPVETMFAAYPVYVLSSPGKENRVRNGNPITVPELVDGLYRVHGSSGAFLCLSRAKSGTLTSIKNFFGA